MRKKKQPLRRLGYGERIIPNTFRVGSWMIGGGIGTALTLNPAGTIAGGLAGEAVFRTGRKAFWRIKRKKK